MRTAWVIMAGLLAGCAAEPAAYGDVPFVSLPGGAYGAPSDALPPGVPAGFDEPGFAEPGYQPFAPDFTPPGIGFVVGGFHPDGGHNHFEHERRAFFERHRLEWAELQHRQFEQQRAAFAAQHAGDPHGGHFHPEARHAVPPDGHHDRHEWH